MQKISIKQLESKKLDGTIWALPSDTIYGFSCLARDKKAVARISQLKQRAPGKGFIILIDKQSSISEFGIEASPRQKKFLNKLWPGPYSIVFDRNDAQYNYLNDLNELAFRVPNNDKLQKLLKKIGPIISTSINISNEPQLTELSEIIEKFEEEIDFFITDSDICSKESSTLIKIIR